MGNVRVTVCRPGELGKAELARWRAFQLASHELRHPFLAPEFACALDSVVSSTRVAVVEDGPGIVGYFPFAKTALGVARPLGGTLSYRQGFVHEPELDWSWRAVLDAAGVPAVEFTDLIGPQATSEGTFSVLPSPVVNTTVTWDEYLKQTQQHRRIKNTRYMARRAERQVGPLSFTWGACSAAELGQLVTWKSQQYRRSGWPDPFAKPWVRTLLDIICAGGTTLQPIFSTLRAGDALFAVDLSLLYQGVYAGWFGAYNRDYATYSPGAIRMLRTVEQACNSDIEYVDLARGDETYKRSFKNEYLEVAEGTVRQRSVRASLDRAARKPARAARTYILERPKVRTFVRSSLRRFGELRARERS